VEPDDIALKGGVLEREDELGSAVVRSVPAVGLEKDTPKISERAAEEIEASCFDRRNLARWLKRKGCRCHFSYF
jgi:hypothetical protein